MFRISKILLPLVAFPLIFSCISPYSASDKENNQTNSSNEEPENDDDSTNLDATPNSDECLIQIHCDNSTASLDGGATWSNSINVIKPIDKLLLIRFKPTNGYTLPSGLYKFEDASGNPITDYTYKEITGTNYRDLTFTPTSDTTIEILADDDCLEFTLTTSSANETVGFSYNGSLEYVDWGDGTLDQQCSHTYPNANQTYTINVAGSLRSVSFGQKNNENAYYTGNKDIYKIELKDSFTSIPADGFNSCVGLTTLDLPKTINKIAAHAFSGCNKLNRIDIDSKNEVYKSYNGSDIVDETTHTLIHATSAKELDSSITTIGPYAYEGSDAANLAIPNTISKIEDYAFKNCTNLKSLNLKSFTSTDTPPTLSDNAFTSSSLLNYELANIDVAEKFASSSSAWNTLYQAGKFTFPSTDYFQITPLADGKVGFKAYSSSTSYTPNSIKLSTKNYADSSSPSWSADKTLSGTAGTTISTDLVNVKANKALLIRGPTSDNPSFGTGFNTATLVSGSHWTIYCVDSNNKPVPFRVSGYLASLINQSNITATSELGKRTFQYLFDSSSVVDASGLILPPDTATAATYVRTFSDCTSLTTAPNLPSAKLSNYCYYRMFASCSSLVDAPELPATTLYSSCYYFMFDSCISLTTAPKLPATTLQSSCYGGMFTGCTSLTSAPTLPATTLAQSCYYYMFKGCSSLTVAPKLPATTLSDSCYYQMFRECTSLTTAPELPATILNDSCYRYMFYGCTSLVTVHDLPEGITLSNASYCCSYMFYKCTSLVTPPKLPATNLAQYCYHYMFSGCTSLTSAPYLPATTLQSYCYYCMFEGCSSLKVNVSSSPCDNLVFTCPSTSGLTSPTYNMFTNSGGSYRAAPTEGLSVYNVDTTNNLCFTAEVDNSTVGYNLYTSTSLEHTSIDTTGIQTSFDNEHWTHWDGSTITLAKAGDKVYVRNINNKLTVATTDYFYFVLGNKIAASGNIDSMINYSSLYSYCYYYMFKNCDALTTPPELPSYVTYQYCYNNMFYNCSSLRYAPQLPAKNVSYYSYHAMFYGCKSLAAAPSQIGQMTNTGCCDYMFHSCEALKVAPILTSTALYASDYDYMFYGCKSLEVAPDLICTNTVNYGYEHMFENCESLVNAPYMGVTDTTAKLACFYYMFANCKNLANSPIAVLPATTVENNSYNHMFYGCAALKTAPEIAATTLGNNACQQMFAQCTSLVNAPTKLYATEIGTNCYASMFNGCEALTKAPTISASAFKTDATGCCSQMFYKCSNLSVSQDSGTTAFFTCPTIQTSGQVSNMFYGTKGSYTGNPTAGKTYYYN